MTTLGKIRGEDWLELQYISSGAIKFMQQHLSEINRIAETFSEPISEAFDDILNKGLDFWIGICEITDAATKGGK